MSLDLYKHMLTSDWLPKKTRQLLVEQYGAIGRHANEQDYNSFSYYITENERSVKDFTDALTEGIKAAVPIDTSDVKQVLNCASITHLPVSDLYPPFNTIWIENTCGEPDKKLGQIMDGCLIHVDKGYKYEGEYPVKDDNGNAVETFSVLVTYFTDFELPCRCTIPSYTFRFSMTAKGKSLYFYLGRHSKNWNAKKGHLSSYLTSDSKLDPKTNNGATINGEEILTNFDVKYFPWTRKTYEENMNHDSNFTIASVTITRVLRLFEFMNAKNIAAKDAPLVPYDELKTMGKKRRRVLRGIKRKTLVVTKPGVNKKITSFAESKDGYVPLHLVRGHLRTYKDKGLFGRYFGTYFIPSHARGDIENGEVIKTYKLRTAK